MQIEETTTPAARTFQLTVTERELQLIENATDSASDRGDSHDGMYDIWLDTYNTMAVLGVETLPRSADNEDDEDDEDDDYDN